MGTTIDVTLTAWPNHPRRIEYFGRVIEALKDKLSASSHELRYFCSAETQPDPDHRWCGDELAELCCRYSVFLSWREGLANLGNNMNAALRLCTADLIFLVQDDHLLCESLDLSPGATLLQTMLTLDMIRYHWDAGPRHDGSGEPRTVLCDHPDGWRRVVDGRIYSDYPHLRRRSFMDKFGWYLEDAKYALSEGTYMLKLKELGATIAVADHPYFAHIGAVPSIIEDDHEARKRLRTTDNAND